jgi:TolA-binding protein
VSSKNLKNIRVGYHPKSIRLVLDVKGLDVPKVSTASEENSLVIRLYSENNDKNITHPPVHENGLTDEKEDNAATNSKQDDIHAKSSMAITQKKAGLTVLAKEENEKAYSGNDDMVYATEQLILLDGPADPDTHSIYVNGIDAYTSHNWLSAVNSLSRYLESSPAGTYVEKAYFLIAKAYDRLYSEKLVTHFNEIKRRYEDAIYRYPQSIYVPDAYLSIGNLCFRTNINSEALGYYNLVLEMEKHVYAKLKALMSKAKLLSKKDKREEALAIYRTVQQQYPGSSEEVQAKIEMAKILFEMNQFQRSLNALSELEGKREYLYQNPHLFRYFGDNYYQLGNFAKAKEHLFRYYNIFPGKQDSHLILARIADAYREEGYSAAATKYYQLVLDRYPDTEGALISMYRIADQQEKGEVKKKKEGVALNFKIIGNDIDLPRTIYENVIQNAIEKDEASPLTQYALLKLSILDRKEKKFASSINILKNLVEKYPRTKLRKEIEHAFEETLLSIFNKDYKVKKYKHIINIFHAEKTIIADLKSPEIFIVVARSAAHLKLEDMAIEMFKNATPYLLDQEKPADLLFNLARDYFDNGELDLASSYVDLLIKNYPEDKYISGAYVLKGKLLSSQKKYAQASAMFAAALEYGSKRCEQPTILIQKAKSLIGSGSSQAAYRALQEAHRIVKNCVNTDYQDFEDMGKLYIKLGYPQEALSVFEFALDMDSEGKQKPRFKLLMARCYEMLNNKESYLAIYNEVANQNDPFWGNVAKEKMDEMSFNPLIRKGKN